MNIGIIAFTKNGAELALKIHQGYKEIGYDCDKYVLKKGFKEGDDITIVDGSLGNWTEEAFLKYQGIVFIGAVGIAVRAIAPFVKSKAEDPAIICIDERGKFAIALLSGHIGGGNKLTEQIAEIIGATPVITTATDINGKFAVDIWAKEQGLEILNLKAIKSVSSAILDSRDVYLYSEVEVKGKPPKNINILNAKEFMEKIKSGETGIFVGNAPERIGLNINEQTLWLGIKNVALGMGCRRNIEYEKVKRLAFREMERLGIKQHQIGALASIDIKSDEAALIELAKELKLPFRCFSSEALLEAKGDFSHSNFVKNTVGVDSVCERAAVVAGAEEAELILKKTAQDGVTIAISLSKVEISF